MTAADDITEDASLSLTEDEGDNHIVHAKLEPLSPSNKDREDDINPTTTQHTTEWTMQQLFARPQTRACLLVYWGLAFCSLAMDEMFPLFCISPTAGLGLPEAAIGQILSVSGILFAVGQCVLQSTSSSSWIMSKKNHHVCCRNTIEGNGLYGSIRCGAVAVVPTFLAVIPSRWVQEALMASNDRSSENHDSSIELAIVTWAYLSIVLALNRLSLLVFFGNISVAINRSAPPASRAVLNGLSVVGGSIFKAMGPAFSGMISTVAIRTLGHYGSVAMFGSLAVAAACAAVSSFVFLRETEDAQINHSSSADDSEGMEVVELRTNPTQSAENSGTDG